MRHILVVALFVGISTTSGWARIGETIEQLTKRYGTASHLHDEEGGLTVVEFNKGSVILTFELLDLKAEGLEAKGLINKAEAEVIMARSIPTQTFTIDANPATPFSDSYVFWLSYTFSNGSEAVYYKFKDSEPGQAVVIIMTPKKQAYDKWRKERKEANQNNEANRKIDLLEKPETAITKTNVLNHTNTPPTIFRDLSAISGGSQMGQDASFASMATALGRYQHKLYLAIGSRWNLKVQQTMAQIGKDSVMVRFHVNADGFITDIDICEGNPNSILGIITGDAIQQVGTLIGPFPADLKAEMPNGFDWQLRFKISEGDSK